ncbi:hypothetical protein GOODEAATRI_014517 [Goodea atripinnis]|uniref:Uncharacterized protein n=1 Tax=Goodea atripinnis TaxID=208336 RepID=A0ABV0PNJ8_9TELE
MARTQLCHLLAEVVLHIHATYSRLEMIYYMKQWEIFLTVTEDFDIHRSLSPEPAGDTLGQQGEAMQSQADGETPSCFAGEEDSHTEQERSSVDGKAAADQTDTIKEADTAGDHGEDSEREIRANAQENQENIPVASEVTVPEEQEEPHNTNGNDAEPDQSGRTQSIISLSASQAAACGGTSESEKKGHVCDPYSDDMNHEDDLRVPLEVPQKAEEEVEVKEEEGVTTKAIEDDQEHVFSADPDVDSVIALSKRLERFVSIKRDKQTRKQEALRYPKVLQRV